MTTELTRWSLKISANADRTVRTYLARKGYKKGDLSKFVEDAVRWPVLDATVTQVGNRFADMAPDELDALIEEAVAAARPTPRSTQRGKPNASSW